MEILRNYSKIDLLVLYAGKVCWDEVNRVKRLARKDCLRLPHFIRDLESYKKKLYQMAIANGLIPKTEKKAPSPKKSPISERRSSVGSPFRRRRLIESGYVGSPCPPPFLRYGSQPCQRKENNPSEISEENKLKVRQKVSADVIFLFEKPSTSNMYEDQDDVHNNNHCNHVAFGNYELGSHGNLRIFSRPPEYTKGNTDIPGSNLYLLTASRNKKESITEETFILPRGSYSQNSITNYVVPKLATQQEIPKYSYETLEM